MWLWLACGGGSLTEPGTTPTDTPVETTDEPGLCTPFPMWLDGDGDGFGDAATETSGCTLLPEHVTNGVDCADDDPLVHPDAPDLCDGVDNDCDGVDEGSGPTRFADADGDGYGDDTVTSQACGEVAGFVDVGGDCADGDPSRHPWAPETCDGIDSDCDGLDVLPGEPPFLFPRHGCLSISSRPPTPEGVSGRSVFATCRTREERLGNCRIRRPPGGRNARRPGVAFRN